MQPDYRIRPITVLEYHRMAELDMFAPGERVELLDGELIAMPPIGRRHAFAVRTLLARFAKLFEGRAVLDVRSSLVLDDFSEPEPDVVLLQAPAERYRSRLPHARDVLLIVEVAESSLAYDRGRKRRAYARCGIPEFWVVDVAASSVIRYREPSGDRYESERAFDADEAMAPLAFEDDLIPVSDLF